VCPYSRSTEPTSIGPLSEAFWCQVVVFGCGCEPLGRTRPGGVFSGVSPGVAYPKSRLSGCGAGRVGVRVVPWLPSRTHSCSGVGEQLPMDGVADSPFQCAARFLRCLSLINLPSVVGATGGVVA
jgi:hypothetical protein